MQQALQRREDATASLDGAAAFGHRPHRFHAAALGDTGLARRLTPTAVLTGHSGAVNTLSWTEGGELLASGGEDCRLRLWRGASGELLHSFDTGHTANILSACFLPGSRGDQLICCSADRQIRHLNVTKGAVRPYLVHTARVRSVLPLDAHLFLSASEDGTVREFDVRQRPVAVHREALAGDDSNVLVDQRAERVGRSRVRVGIYSLAIDEHRPWLMLTGGTDPLLRLYDRRMLPAAGSGGGGGGHGGEAHGGSRSKTPQWVSCYVPSHIKAAVWDSGRHPALTSAAAAAPAGRHVTSVAFARGGSEVVGSYSGEFIYSFGVAQHARDVEALLHIPHTVLRAPTRPRSHMGRRSMHDFAHASQGPQWQWQSPPAAAGGDGATAAEGGGGTAPGSAEQLAAALAAQQAGQVRQQQRPLAGRGIGIAASVRQLERQRRQLSRVAAATAEPPRAESSRPAHWQMRPTSSTLRSPHNNFRQQYALQQAAAAQRQQDEQQQQHQNQQHLDSVHLTHHQHQHQQPHELVSDSEGVSEGVSPDGHPHPRQAVRRSRRIMRRRRDAAADALEQEALHQIQESDPMAGAAAAGEGVADHQRHHFHQQHMQQQHQQQQGGLLGAQLEVQQPAVSGVAEPAPLAAAPHSSSDSEDPELHSPLTRQRVRRRKLAGATADGGTAVGLEVQQGSPGNAAAAAAGGQAGGTVGSDGVFKAPAGKSPHRRQAAAAAAAAAATAAAIQRLDSTVGLLHQQGVQLEASEVAAGDGGGGGCWGGQQAQQEATVSMGPRHQHTAVGGAAGECAGLLERSPALEVTSRPVPSTSQVGLGTQLGSQQAGHEASSLNSAEQPAVERVGSVAQRHRADAPSVGNAPATTTAAAGGGGAAGAQAAAQHEQQQQRQRAAAEASTGHNVGARTSVDRLLPPPPQYWAQGQQQQQQGPPVGTRQWHQLQPTASTGTSKPPAFGSQQQHHAHHQQRYLPPQASGRQASRLRRHSAGLHTVEAGTTVAGSQAAGGTAAAAAAGARQEQEQEAALAQQQHLQQHAQPPALVQSAAARQGASAQQQQEQAEPQTTMLSGRGPSVLGDFRPDQQQPADSEIQQRQASMAADMPAAAAGGGAGRQAAQQAPPAQLQQQQRREAPVDSWVGAIVHNADAEGGEEVSEPTMYRCCFAGHLNQSPAHDGLPLAPQFGFLGMHSEVLVSPSDDGNLYVWRYATGQLLAVLPATSPAAQAGSAGSSRGLVGGSDGGCGGTAAGTCVAPHPLLPVLASGGMDSVVRLWSPEAAQQCGVDHAAAVVGANLCCLTEQGLQPLPEGMVEGLLRGAAQGSGDCA